jgi:hypothetical protein
VGALDNHVAWRRQHEPIADMERVQEDVAACDEPQASSLA